MIHLTASTMSSRYFLDELGDEGQPVVGMFLTEKTELALANSIPVNRRLWAARL